MKIEKEILLFFLGRFEIFGLANDYLTTFQSVFVEQNMIFSTPTQNLDQIEKDKYFANNFVLFKKFYVEIMNSMKSRYKYV